jgi:hypothetical protein
MPGKPTVRVIPIPLPTGPAGPAAQRLQDMIQERLDDGWTFRGVIPHNSKAVVQPPLVPGVNDKMVHLVYVKRVRDG